MRKKWKQFNLRKTKNIAGIVIILCIATTVLFRISIYRVAMIPRQESTLSICKQHQLLIEHTLLMGQFNFPPNIDGVVFWHQQWKSLFRHVVIYGPFTKPELDMLRQTHGILCHKGRSDMGYSYPMENLANALKNYANVEGIKGVLYIHDDTLLNISNIPIGTDTIVASSDVSNPRMGLNETRRRKQVAKVSYSILPDGSVSKVDGWKSYNPLTIANTMNTPWRWNECIAKFHVIFGDPRSQPYREPDGSFLIPSPSFGGSDLLYVPTKFADDFSKAAQLMANHQLFLECGFPKIIDILQQKYNATAVSVPLCTNFLASRGTLKMLTQCNSPISVVHPFKIGKQGYKNWTYAFVWATT